MPKGLLYVASRPVSPDRADEFNAWYTEVHLREIVALDGFVAARRFAPVTDDGPYVALYEMDGDLQEVFSGMLAAARGGKLQMSDSMQLDPPPTMRLLEVTAEYRPEIVG